jgi:uncharacterized delta-60 repeat protein
MHQTSIVLASSKGKYVSFKGRYRVQAEQLEGRLLFSSGNLDILFNQTGILATSFSNGPAQASTIAAQSDGKILVAGTVGSNSSEFGIARYFRDGALDSTFGSGGEVVTSLGANEPAEANAVAIGPGSTIIVAGTVGQVGSQEFALARYLLNGALDPTFGTGGIVLTSFAGSAGANSVAVASDGSIIAAGFVEPQAGSSDSSFALARHLADITGALDTTFDTGGFTTAPFPGSDKLRSVRGSTLT